MRCIGNFLFGLLLLIAIGIGICGCGKPKPVAVGQDGREFFEPAHTPEQLALLERNLATATKNFKEDPSEENYIWYGRRVAYFMRLPEAIEIYTEGLEKFPQSYKLLRHRGHRYISIREFDKAIVDLERAAELMKGKPVESEPDGVPNKLNIPKSTIQSNVWYHLGLAYYLKGDYAKAAAAYEEGMKFSDNDDLLVATSDWLFMTYYRLGKTEEANRLLDRITPQMGIIENDAYLKRLLMYKGLQRPDLLLAIEEGGVDPSIAIATQGYGVGNWYLIQGDTAKAQGVFAEVVKGSSFAAFGFIAAETDLKRLNFR